MKTNVIFLIGSFLLTFLSLGLADPTFTKHPTNQSVSLGANVQFVSLATTTNPPLNYQWRLASTNLPARTSASLSLTNVQLADAGDYDVVATAGSSSATSHLAHLDVDPTFTKITTGRIVTDVGTGTACAWGDYDGDGFLDLIVTSAFNPQTFAAQNIILFHNNGDGTFSKVTNTVITAEARDWRGCSWIDYDNDGNLDLFVTSTDFNGFSSQNELFRNNGDGTFTKMTSAVVGAIVPGGGGSEGPVWADYDRDGFLDLYIVRYSVDWMFQGSGDGTFIKVPNTNGIPADSYDSYRAAWGDYDHDGWPDLLVPVSTDTGLTPDRLYRGLGSGIFTNTFTNALIGSVTNRGETSSGAWADYDNDGFLDLFLVRFISGGSTTNSLYHNSGDGTLTRMASSTVGSIASDASANFGECAWGDYDNDGVIDLFVTTFGEASANFLYHNNGDGSFTRILAGSVVNDAANYSLSCAWGDYDNDGFLDLFVTCGNDSVPARNLLYRNNGNSNAWIKVKLVGTASNRSAIGAKVRVQATIRGRAMRQMREINSGDGFSAGPLEAHFGLGDATNIDKVRIEWPSGIVQTLTNVAPKQILTVVEHQQPTATNAPIFTSVSRSTDGAVDLSVTGDSNLLYMFEASANLVNWAKVGVRSNATGIVAFTDSKATNYASRFYRVSAP